MSANPPPREGDSGEYGAADKAGLEALGALFAAARGGAGAAPAGDEARIGATDEADAAPGAGSKAEAEAVAAFRRARDAGAHRGARTRRRDDWRPRSAARRLAWRAGIGAVLAGLTVGGAAVAGTGMAGGDSGEWAGGGAVPAAASL
ncbi:hypothetical protein [Streptomyces sp. KLOTTS4A1]|uniref:hypothetical protein n=1 Tax=Streptomyces sp. KLOTTS4A1 TaxID=3390996 RepID=UPI0039F5ED9F